MKRITVDQYSTAINDLVNLAKSDTGGSRVAAQVLLSAYNGSEYQLDIVDLGLLDEKHYLAALIVIRGRTECNQEPHTVIDNGDKIFSNLCGRWKGYNVKFRANLL